MKVYRFLLIGLLFVSLVSFEFEDPMYNPSEYEARIMYRKDLEKSIELSGPEDLTSSGKLYYKDNFIFVSKRYEGIHIIDNHDPVNPQNIGFIKIPGCMDMAIKQNILYADNATDLVAINLSLLPTSLEVVKRISKAFPNPLPPDLDYIPEPFRAYNRPDNTVIVGWKRY